MSPRIDSFSSLLSSLFSTDHNNKYTPENNRQSPGPVCRDLREPFCPLVDPAQKDEQSIFSSLWDSFTSTTRSFIKPIYNSFTDAVTSPLRWTRSVIKSADMTLDWALGIGSDHRYFDGESDQSMNMSDAYKVNQAREAFYEKNEGIPCEDWVPYLNVKGSFGLEGLLRAGVDPTEQFVGGYKIDINPNPDCSLNFELTNDTSMTSFLYGVGPEYKREDLQVGGNMRQTYRWTEESWSEESPNE